MDVITAVITFVIVIAISLIILHAIIKSAVTKAMRQARHEERVEQMLPKATTWLLVDQRELLVKANERAARETGTAATQAR